MSKGRKLRTFAAADAVYRAFRSAGAGRQNICQWIGPESGAPYQAGITELSRIRIADYTFTFDDFFVLEGSITIIQEGARRTLGPGAVEEL